ncbi:MAG: hypothetical protein O9262_02010, partial [Cyclobacteriaceae bacterium]|nr:hypothetical protein [Cyclobacteriaceae bacterium]
MRFLIIITATICLTNCIHTKVSSNSKNIEVLKTEKGRAICIETNREEFFEKMINQGMSKTQGNNWNILYRDTAYIYYGYTYLTKRGLFADNIFKVKKSLISEFPKFEQLNFYEINDI